MVESKNNGIEVCDAMFNLQHCLNVRNYFLHKIFATMEIDRS